MTTRKPTMRQRVMDWAGEKVAHMIWSGRLKKTPARDTTPYARLMNIGGQRYSRDRPTIKASPSNLRRFSKTVFARRAINRVKNSVAALKWEVAPKEGVTKNAEIQRQIEIVTMCFARPNQDDSFRTLIEQVCEDLLICGAGAIEQETGGDLIRPLWMWPVDALSIEIFAGWTGARDEARYMQTHGFGNIGGQQGIPLRNDQLIYIRKDPTTDNPFGVGCLEVAYSSINRLLSTEDYAGNVAGNAQPANMLQFTGMDKGTLDTFREWWRNEIEGQGMTPLIGGDEAKVHNLRGATDEALYLGYQELLIREIATAFEISPGNLGIEHDVNRATAEVADDRDWAGAIIPAATNIAAYLNREAIEAKLGFSQIEFRFLGIDRDDEQMLSGIHEKYLKNSVLTPNEVREKLGREPLKSKWGDLLAVDQQIAIIAAKGLGQDLDDDLPGEPAKEPAESGKDDEGRSQRGRTSNKTKRSNSND